MKILVVDDERQIARVLKTSLQSYGYEVAVAQDGLEAIDVFERFAPDLVITDLSMPNMDGVELTKELRRRGDTPILVLSVRDQDAMKILALDSGADDYVTKPFSMPELLARVRVQLRRRVEEDSLPTLVEAGAFSIDTERHRVRRDGEEIHLTPKEFDLLLTLTRNAGRAMTHKTLLRTVWGPSAEDQPEYLRVLVAQLRRKIDRAGSESYIRNEPWVGYRFESGS